MSYPNNQYPQGQPQQGYPGQQPPQGYPPYGASPPQGYPPQGGPPPQGYPPQGQPPHVGFAPGGPYPNQGPPQGTGYPPAGGAMPPGPAGGYGPPPAGSAEKPPIAGVPDQDVPENPNATAPSPSAPPMEKMDPISGYGNISFNSDDFLPPPSYEEAIAPPETPHRPPAAVSAINEDQARDALVEYVSQHCCYGKKPARDMKLNDLESSSAFHYCLESFGEARSTKWKYEPFNGQPVDGPHNGPAPGPWNVVVAYPEKFKDSTINVEVPHTASVKPCHECGGMGRKRCWHCHGRGMNRCSSCSGRGHRQMHGETEQCTWCHGSGRRRCLHCHGNGMCQCNVCQGKGMLKCYIQLTVKWVNHKDDFIVEKTALPADLIKTVSGQVDFTDEQLRVWPVNHFPDVSINKASKDIVAKHSTAFPTEKIVLQRHQVRIIPVTRCTYNYSGKDGTFFVYGFEHKVYTNDYPQTCCCGCTIL